jgi:hypothetical protein
VLNKFLDMSLVELEKEVQNLTPGEFSAFTRWLDEYASQKWEDQFATDVKEGKLDALGKKADEAFDLDQCSEL